MKPHPLFGRGSKGPRNRHATTVKACVDYLRLNGIPAYALNQKPQRLSDGRWLSLGAPAGLPDLIACVPPTGHWLGVEVKKKADAISKKDDRQRTAQVLVAAELRLAGASVLVVHEVSDLEPLVREFKALERAATR